MKWELLTSSVFYTSFCRLKIFYSGEDEQIPLCPPAAGKKSPPDFVPRSLTTLLFWPRITILLFLLEHILTTAFRRDHFYNYCVIITQNYLVKDIIIHQIEKAGLEAPTPTSHFQFDRTSSQEISQHLHACRVLHCSRCWVSPGVHTSS